MTQNNQHPEAPDQNLENSTLFGTQSANDSASRRVQVSSPEEVLAYIQCTLGFLPVNSLVVVAFADNELSTVVRCDLPEQLQHMLRSDTPESVTYIDYGLTELQELQFIDIGRHIGQLMDREPSTKSCVLLYLSDDVTVSDYQALSVTGTANAVITPQFALQRVPVEESWFIHHSLLWHVRCAATTECTVQGHDVGDPEQTAIFQALNPSGTTAQEQHLTARQLIFPPAPLTSSKVIPDTHTLLRHRPQVALNWIRLWDDHVHGGPRMLHSDQVAQLLESLEHGRIRDAILALTCFDFTSAIQGMVTLGQFPAQIASAAELSTNVTDGVAVKDCIKGQSERPPNWQRIHELERLCHQLLPLSDEHSGAAVAGILVWIEWVRGRGSIAMAYVQQASERFSSDPFLSRLEGFLQQGVVAGWATRTQSAWSPATRNQRA